MKKHTESKSPSNPAEPMRLNKYVAKAGVCSRREAAELIKKGNVSVNGVVHKEPGYLTKPEDVITFKGKEIKPSRKLVYILLNKPKNMLTSMKDERGRPTIADAVNALTQERVFPVDKLDRNTTGLLLLTNDGELTEKLAAPKNKVKKVYQLTLDKNVTDGHIHKISRGIELDGQVAKMDLVSHILNKPLREVIVEISSIKTTQVQPIFELLGYKVEKIDRVRYAGLTKKNLGRGRARMLTPKEVIFLKHFSPA